MSVALFSAIKVKSIEAPAKSAAETRGIANRAIWERQFERLGAVVTPGLRAEHPSAGPGSIPWWREKCD